MTDLLGIGGGLQSPFELFCDDLDEKMVKSGINDPGSYFVYVQKHISTEYLTALFIEDIKFRERFKMNVLASFEGQPGRAFKSLQALYVAFLLAKIFGVPFDMDKHIVTDPFELEKKVKEAPDRSTFLYDEVKKTRAGLMSMTNFFRLIDYEEQGRFAQPNILFASPNVVDKNHYFQFREHSNTRLVNKTCEKCNFQKECYRLDQTKTLCINSKKVRKKIGLKKGIPFWERSGYPKSVSFYLWTKRKFDGLVCPRGIITFPMVHPNVLIKYEKIKKKSLIALKADDSSFWRSLQEFAKDFVNRNFENLKRTLKNGQEVPVKIRKIEITLYDEITPNKYTVAVNKLLTELIQIKITEKIENPQKEPLRKAFKQKKPTILHGKKKKKLNEDAENPKS